MSMMTEDECVMAQLLSPLSDNDNASTTLSWEGERAEDTPGGEAIKLHTREIIWQNDKVQEVYNKLDARQNDEDMDCVSAADTLCPAAIDFVNSFLSDLAKPVLTTSEGAQAGPVNVVASGQLSPSFGDQQSKNDCQIQPSRYVLFAKVLAKLLIFYGIGASCSNGVKVKNVRVSQKNSSAANNESKVGRKPPDQELLRDRWQDDKSKGRFKQALVSAFSKDILTYKEDADKSIGVFGIIEVEVKDGKRFGEFIYKSHDSQISFLPYMSEAKRPKNNFILHMTRKGFECSYCIVEDVFKLSAPPAKDGRTVPFENDIRFRRFIRLVTTVKDILASHFQAAVLLYLPASAQLIADGPSSPSAAGPSLVLTPPFAADKTINSSVAPAAGPFLVLGAEAVTGMAAADGESEVGTAQCREMLDGLVEILLRHLQLCPGASGGTGVGGLVEGLGGDEEAEKMRRAWAARLKLWGDCQAVVKEGIQFVLGLVNRLITVCCANRSLSGGPAAAAAGFGTWAMGMRKYVEALERIRDMLADAFPKRDGELYPSLYVWHPGQYRLKRPRSTAAAKGASAAKGEGGGGGGAATKAAKGEGGGGGGAATKAAKGEGGGGGGGGAATKAAKGEGGGGGGGGAATKAAKGEGAGGRAVKKRRTTAATTPGDGET